MPRRDFADAAPAIPAVLQPAHAFRPLPENVSITPQTRGLVDRWLAALQQNNLDGQVMLQVEERRVSLQIRDRLLFPSGQIDIQPGGDQMIRRLAAMLRTLPGTISVEGHTDDEIGRASCRESVCLYVWISVVAVTLKKQIKKIT